MLTNREEQVNLRYRKPVKELLSVLLFSIVFVVCWAGLISWIRSVSLPHEDRLILQETATKVADGLQRGRTAAVDKVLTECVTCRPSLVDELTLQYADYLPVLPELRSRLNSMVSEGGVSDRATADELATRLRDHAAPAVEPMKDGGECGATCVRSRMLALEWQKFDLLPVLPPTTPDALRSLPRNSILFARFPLILVSDDAPIPVDRKNYFEGMRRLLNGELDQAWTPFSRALQEADSGDAAYWLGALSEAKCDATTAEDFYKQAVCMTGHSEAAKALLGITAARASK